MKNRKKYQSLTSILLGLALTIGVTALAPAQGLVDSQFARMYAGDPVSGAVGAVQTGDVFMVVKYVGANHGGGASGKVAVAAGGDITFTSGAAGSEAADTTLECPVSGALGGVIDVSDTACDTMGEVVDIINASANWRAVLVDSMRTDSSNDTLYTLSATAANKPEGLALYHDNTVDFTVSAALAVPQLRDMRGYLRNRNDQLEANPFTGQRSLVRILNEKTTYGSGTSTINIYSCLENYSTTSGSSSETCTLQYSTAGGATTVAGSLDFSAGGGGFLGGKNEKQIVRVTNSAAMTAATLYAYGLQWFYR